MANSHHIDPCRCTEAVATRMIGFPFNRSSDFCRLV
ncbi:hypothetical protein SAMN05880592_10327 [Bosea sp. TND4EK4]|nr:hypothetical protein SAMN05880592_10327 [Bosea sp. TND4EK4]